MPVHRICIRLTYIILASLVLSITAWSQSAPVDLNALDRYIAKAVSDWEVPGMAIAIVKDDATVLSKGYGVREIGASDPVDEHTLFAIASLSKAFTATALGMLVDEGKLKWNDKVTNYLPAFQMYDPYVTREMLVRDLLCHRSGLHTFGGDLIWYGTSYSRDEVIRRIRYLKPRFSFRANYGYQNIMFLAAGEIIPALTGKSWDEFARDSILLPLGMTETNTSVKMLAGNANVATPHTKHKEKTITVPYRDVDNVGPAASLNSNVSDLAKWIKFWLANDSVNVLHLSPAARHEIMSPQTIQNLSAEALRLIPDRHFAAYGLGWGLFDYRGRKVLMHGGGMDGMISRIVLVPEEKLGFVMLTNSINGMMTPLVFRILDGYLGGVQERDWSAEYLQKKAEGEQKEKDEKRKADSLRVKGTKPSLPLETYAGTYRSEMYGDVVASVEGGRLVVRFLPTASFVGDLTHWHYETFQIELRDPTLPPGMVTFVLNAAGLPAEMKIDIPNPDFDFTELELKRVK